MTVVWVSFQIGSLIADSFEEAALCSASAFDQHILDSLALLLPLAFFADAFNPQVLFWLCAPLAASIVIPTALGYLNDPKVAPEKQGVDWALLRKHPYIIMYCLLMATMVILRARSGLEREQPWQYYMHAVASNKSAAWRAVQSGTPHFRSEIFC